MPLQSKMPQLDSVYLPALVFFANAELGGLVPDTYMLYFLCAYNTFNFGAHRSWLVAESLPRALISAGLKGTYCMTVIGEICAHLRIECFRIVPKVPAAAAAPH